MFRRSVPLRDIHQAILIALTHYFESLSKPTFGRGLASAYVLSIYHTYKLVLLLNQQLLVATIRLSSTQGPKKYLQLAENPSQALPQQLIRFLSSRNVPSQLHLALSLHNLQILNRPPQPFLSLPKSFLRAINPIIKLPNRPNLSRHQSRPVRILFNSLEPIVNVHWLIIDSERHVL